MFDSNMEDMLTATFKKVEGDYIICDIKVGKPSRKKQLVHGKVKTVTDKNMIENAKVKLDLNNDNLLKKVKKLKNKEEVTLKFIRPMREYYFNSENYNLIDVLDRFDLNELRNRNSLFQTPCITREEYEKRNLKKKTKTETIAEKESKINELEIENAKLKLKIQELQQQSQIFIQ